MFGVYLLILISHALTMKHRESPAIFQKRLFNFDHVYDQQSAKNEDMEIKLMDYLFDSGIRKDIRPIRNKTKSLNVKFGIAYVTLGRLNDKEQLLTSNIWVRQTWKNEFLTWEPKDFGGITRINVEANKIWVPDITLYNNAVHGKYSGTMFSFKTKVQLFHDGVNKWYSPATVNSACSIDITWFPFDYQICPLVFGSWAYHGYQLDVKSDLPSADLSFYDPSSQFELIDLPVYRELKYYSCCPQPFPVLTYKVAIKRMPGYHFYHIIIPSLAMTVLSLLTFISPHLTGERIGLAIESFLSLFFLLVLASEVMPENSNFTPMISKFLLCCMTIISGTVLCNLISANLCRKTKVPFAVRYIMFKCIAPLIGFADLKLIYSTDNENRELFINRKKSKKKSRIDITISNMRELIEMSEKKREEEINREFWCCIAKTFDRFCLLSFLIALCVSVALIMLQGYIKSAPEKGL